MASGLGDCIPFATVKQCREYDFIVVVKRTPPEVISAVRASGRPWAWDVVDAYPQPECAKWSKEQGVAWLQHQVKLLRPTVTCWATRRMQEDVGLGGYVIYHHHRQAIATNPIRDRIHKIGYDGSPKFLGAKWSAALASAAQSIGATFDDRVASLADCDVVVAVRGGEASCYATHNWKSNVKLANAHASGTPFIGQPDAGYLETQTEAECWVERPQQLASALERLASRQVREQVSRTFTAATIGLQICQLQWRKIAEAHA